MSESYFKKTPDELRRIMDTSPPDTPAYIKARDALRSLGEPLKAYVYQPYPRVLYHWKFGTKTVQSEEEEKKLFVLNKDWVDSPAKVWKPRRLYHPTLKPDGHIFESPEEETRGLNNGWVDSPAKFPAPAPVPSPRRLERFVQVVAIIGGLAAFVWTLIQISNWASTRP